MPGRTLDPTPVGATKLSNGRWLIPKYRKLDGPRPLSPFEELTGIRFSDHRSPTDVRLDEIMKKEEAVRPPRDVRQSVLDAARDGLADWEIARALGISEDTVSRYSRLVHGPPTQRLWCVTGGHWWTRKARNGQLPWSCDRHQAGRQQ